MKKDRYALLIRVEHSALINDPVYEAMSYDNGNPKILTWGAVRRAILAYQLKPSQYKVKKVRI